MPHGPDYPYTNINGHKNCVQTQSCARDPRITTLPSAQSCVVTPQAAGQKVNWGRWTWRSINNAWKEFFMRTHNLDILFSIKDTEMVFVCTKEDAPSYLSSNTVLPGALPHSRVWEQCGCRRTGPHHEASHSAAVMLNGTCRITTILEGPPSQTWAVSISVVTRNSRAGLPNLVFLKISH